ncbi:MAG TPA: LAGLIDADG family homing endonuclease [Rugosimonospora sp.]|nr:LAGLIDADG family homing endonuclease [Rugosimonospora sp.]
MARTWVDADPEPRTMRYAEVAPRECGKALAVDTPVLTTNGWKRHGDIATGDEVFGPDGKPIKVVDVSPIWQDRPAYRLTFSDGESIIADENHEWSVFDRYRSRILIRSTKDMARDWLLTDRRGYREVRYSIPTCQPVEFPTAHLPVPPYTLGAWLGDGHSSGTAFTSADSEIIERMRQDGTRIVHRPSPYLFGLPGFVRCLKAAGFEIITRYPNHSVKFAKRIPEAYFTASVEQRFDLMRGLMDTDGSIDQRAICEYSGTNEDLCRDVLRLARSLGIKAVLRTGRATINGVDKGPKWRVCFKTDLPIFHLPRKVERLGAVKAAKTRQIVNVEQVEPQATNCISVDSEDHLYLAGESLIATHNSTWWFLILVMWAAAHGHRRFAAAFADSTGQAETHLATFKGELDRNELLREDFPKLCEPARRRSGGTTADRQGMLHTRAGFTFAARGIDASNLGLKVGETRPDLILFDDVEPDESSYSEHQARKRLTTITDAILPMNLWAIVVLVGTVTMPGSVVHQLVRSLSETPEQWITDERFVAHHYDPIVVRDDGTERSIWPAKWPLTFLNSIRHTRSYLKNFKNDPLGSDGGYWSIDDFRYGDVDGVTGHLLSVDPAVTTKTTSDLTGIAIIGYAPARPGVEAQCVVEHAEEIRKTGAALRDHLLRLLEQWPTVRMVLVETNQGGENWLDILHDLPCRLVTVHNTAPKEVRAANVLNHYQRRRVTHRVRLVRCEEQMVSFPKAAHDDMVDAVGNGVLRLFSPAKPKTRTAYQN